MGKFINATFRFIIFAVMTYFIVKQIIRYFKNNDSPVFAYTRFLDKAKDNYPVFTFCIEEGAGIYREDNLESLGLTGMEYQNFLSGKNVDKANETRLHEIDFDSTMLQLEKIVPSFKIIAQNATGGGEMVTWKASKDEIKPNPFPPMYKSYQDPEKLCFSRNNSYGPQGIRAHEYLMLNRTLLRAMNGKLRVYHHQTNQALKRICKYVISKDVGEIDFGMIEFWVSQVNVLRKRVDANEPCNPDINDDQAVLETTLKKVNCTPPYWKTMMSQENDFSNCNSSTQLKEIHSVLKAPDKLMSIFTQYTPPCDKLASIVTFQEKDKNPDNDDDSLLLVFNYLEEMYQEITNKRDFDMEMMWSSVGGFVGMFLGYSLWQCPEMLLGCTFVKTLKKY